MKKKQEGAALLVSLVLSTISLMLGVVVLQSSLLEEAASGNQRSSANSLMAAEYAGSLALKSVDFSALSIGGCASQSGNVGNSQSSITYSYQACKGSGGGVGIIEAKGNAGGIEREVYIEYLLASGFLGLSPITLPTPLTSFAAANSNNFVVEGQASDGVAGGHMPAISTLGYKSFIESNIKDGRLDNYAGGISDTISESVVEDPDLFHGFLSDVRSAAEGVERIFTAIEGVDFGTVSGGEDGEASSKLTYIDGDMSVSGSWSGRGLLVVNGNLSLSGTPYFEGLVIVLGDTYTLDGGGNGGISCSVIVAPMTGGGTSEVSYAHADVTVSGGGNAQYSYNAEALDDAFSLLSGTAAEDTWNAQNTSTSSSNVISKWQEQVM